MRRTQRGLALLLALCLLLLSACGERRREAEENVIDDKYRNWYEVFVYSYYDSDGDRIGDLAGLAEKLDYIASLGMNGIWLMPIMPSPSYHKYDVTDYYDIDPQYGTLEDFSALLDKAHSLGIDVIIDLVVNHTSSEHPWFLSAKADVNSEYREYYNWSDEPRDGYAKAVKLVCGELGIPCVLVRSETHMWNNVQMDDGLWYNLDLTWDDEGEELSYDYFLIGSETVVDGQAFSQQGDHQEVDVYQLASGADPVTLPYPVKNREAYEYQGEDYPPLTFPDVTRDAWYFEAVEESAALGLFHGDDQGLFQPERDITRAEFCQVAANALGSDWEDFEGENQFTDVADGAWYVQVVAWAAQEGIMNGDGDGRFRPEDPITREEMCQVLYNLLGRQPVEDEGDSLFPDDGEISPWAREAVYACHSLGLVLGNDDGSFRPRENTQRSQAATVFVRYSKAA